MIYGPLLAVLIGLGAVPAAAAGRPYLPAANVPVRVDGDPREAFLFGAAALPAWDAVTGVPDGSVRVYALATPRGLYVVLLSTEPDGGAGLLRPLPWSPPEEAVLGDWMAVRVGPPSGTSLFLLAPGGFRTVLDGRGLKAPEAPPWQGADRVFGRTWAGEWLLPWETLEAGGGRVEVLRGRKIRAGRQAQESLAQTSPRPAVGRWGGEGLPVARPGRWPEPVPLRALRPYDNRPFIPPEEGVAACAEAAPEGEYATAWVEVAPGPGKLRLEAEAGLLETEVFRVEFRWQAGTREEIDAFLPARAAQGLGDVLAGDLLRPQPPEGFDGAGEPVRFYVRARLPVKEGSQGPPGTGGAAGNGKTGPSATERGVAGALRLFRDGRPAGTLPWRIETAPPLPPPEGLAGAYYLEPDPARWDGDLRDLKRHGLTAATCPARDAAGWRRFQETAAAAGLDGSFALHPEAVPEGESAWAYVWDEPATADQMAGARIRAEAFGKRGLRRWAALAWPHTLGLCAVLDGVAVAPALVGQAPLLPPARRWVYVQALREDPFYNRAWAALLSRAPGLAGFWVFCYAPSQDGEEDDWKGPIVRYDALVSPGEDGIRLPTVPFEALREGIVDGRLLDALGPEGEALLARFPGAGAARAGAYWEARGRGWDFSTLRRALVRAWAARGRPGPPPGAPGGR